MSDEGEKRFDATPARRERAKREGQNARSAELAGAASFAAGVAALAAMCPVLATVAARAVRAGAAYPSHAAGDALLPLVGVACVPALAACIAGVGASAAQTGGLRLAPLKFAFAKLAPHAGLKRMLGGEAAVGAARAIVALAVALAAVAPIAQHVLTVAARASSPAVAAQAARDGAVAACFACALVGAGFGLADYGLVRRRWLHALKMSFDAFKRDMKEQDGDPQARSRRRNLHRAIARGAVARTREATFVVVNPTHVAVALRYAPPAVPVPEILVRAVDAAALAVRDIAQRHGVPVVANVALARWLFRCGENGRPIPAETFVAVAEVIAALVRAGVLDV